MASGDYSWIIGSAESPLVRWLLNLATGVYLGYGIVLTLPLFGWPGGSPEVLIAGLLVAILVVIIVVRAAVAIKISRINWLFDAFSETVRPVEIGIATAIAIVVFLSLPVDIYSARVVVIPLWLVYTVGAILVSSKGTLDTATGTLTYTAVRQHEIPLADVTTLTAVAIGGRTYLWLSFHRTDGTPVDRLVLVPTDVWENVGSQFEPSDRRDDETDESARPLRVELIAGLLIFGFLAGGLAVIVYLGGGGVTGALMISLVLFAVPFALFLIAHFTNLFSQVPSK